MTSLPLAGEWHLKLDPKDEGVSDTWFSRTLPDRVTLPGSLAVQKIGDEVTVDAAWTGTIFGRSHFDSPAYDPYRKPGAIKIPFWLQPEKLFVGAAWYQREIEIPASWQGGELFLERPHGQTRVWLDNREIGSGDSLSTPHEFPLDGIAPGRYRLTIRVDNRLRIEVGENAHSVSDHSQGNWNGIVGEIALRPKSAVEELEITPHFATRSVTVTGRSDSDVTLDIRLNEKDEIIATAVAAVEDGRFAIEIPLGPDAVLWDEFHPTLYKLSAIVDGKTKNVVFGLREISVAGTQFEINGRRAFLRGTLDCCVFPLTGHPPMDVASWREVLKKIKAYGLNHVRFHSWCPPEAAFIAADELGIYFQVECGVWPNAVPVLSFKSPSGIGDGNAVDAWTLREGERIRRAYGNHPCFVFLGCGNEPGGPHHCEYLSRWINHLRAFDPRCLYTGGAGWPELPENEFHVIPKPRVYLWGDGLSCRFNSQPPATTHDYRAIIEERDVPVIAHESGQWCAYPPLYDTGKYQGHLKANNYEIFAKSLDAQGMADQLHDFVQASGKLQVLCYKEEIESALRTPGMGGFQLLSLQDFSGQGTAPVGILDAFWDSKGYLEAAEMRRFCEATVPLARLTKRVFTTQEQIDAEIEVSHFGKCDLKKAFVRWELIDSNGLSLSNGSFPEQMLPTGALTFIGRASINLNGLDAPAKYRLVVHIETPEQAFENDWELWVYPPVINTIVPQNVTLLTSSEQDAIPHLEAGRTVILMPHYKEASPSIAFGFTPIFWNTACSRGQPPHTLGILCDPEHPIFGEFPTDLHTNWQWWYLVQRSVVMNMDAAPQTLRPIIQVIDDWFTNRRLGLIWEAQVGPGRLLYCGIDFRNDSDPVLRQFRQSLLAYAENNGVQPTTQLTFDELKFLLKAQLCDSTPS